MEFFGGNSAFSPKMPLHVQMRQTLFGNVICGRKKNPPHPYEGDTFFFLLTSFPTHFYTLTITKPM